MNDHIPRCVQCSRPIAEHRTITADDVLASKSATLANPVKLTDRYAVLCPLSPSTIGQWIAHKPMPWNDPEAERAYYAKHGKESP